jgi:hypothetical protein
MGGHRACAFDERGADHDEAVIDAAFAGQETLEGFECADLVHGAAEFLGNKQLRVRRADAVFAGLAEKRAAQPFALGGVELRLPPWFPLRLRFSRHCLSSI